MKVTGIKQVVIQTRSSLEIEGEQVETILRRALKLSEDMNLILLPKARCSAHEELGCNDVRFELRWSSETREETEIEAGMTALEEVGLGSPFWVMVKCRRRALGDDEKSFFATTQHLLSADQYGKVERADKVEILSDKTEVRFWNDGVVTTEPLLTIRTR